MKRLRSAAADLLLRASTWLRPGSGARGNPIVLTIIGTSDHATKRQIAAWVREVSG